jgi:hypothetical protein
MEHGVNDDSLGRVLINDHVFLNREEEYWTRGQIHSRMARSRKLLRKSEGLEEFFFDLVRD